MSDTSSSPNTSSDKSNQEKLIAHDLLFHMTEEEIERAKIVESVLPFLRETAVQADHDAAFVLSHIEKFKACGLLGLIVPKEYGGLGGGLRDLTAATYTLGTACGSTALAFFFHCSSASRGLLALEALENNAFTAEEIPLVEQFATKVLSRMPQHWMGNFGSESPKSAHSTLTIKTTATPAEGGWILNGVKFFGCGTGFADYYLVTAKLEGYDTAEGLATFFVPRQAQGVTERGVWNPIGMRASSSQGIVLKDVFVPADEALTIPSAFVTMLQYSRGSFVGNQLASAAGYVGIAKNVYDFALEFLLSMRFHDTQELIVKNSSFHQVLIGQMKADLNTAIMWLQRQLELETSNPPLRPKVEVVEHWRLCKGQMAEAAFQVAINALKACGTRNTVNDGVIARAIRDLSMLLVQAFPMERGQIEAAKMIINQQETKTFSV